MIPQDDKTRQILQVHAQFIHAVVRACQNRDLRPPLEGFLRQAVEQGWGELVAAVRLVLEGRRDAGVLQGLDDDDRIIISTILAGLQNPAVLPDPDAAPADSTHAAPGLAHMIHLARRGDAQALQALANMGEQMVSAGGDMARLGGSFRALLDGERDADKLCREMSSKGRSLMLSLLEELGKLDSH